MAEENLTVIREKFSNTISNKMKAQVWQAISNKVNSLGVAQRTINEVKDKWRSMVGVARKEFNLEKRLRKTETGGGKQPAPCQLMPSELFIFLRTNLGFPVYLEVLNRASALDAMLRLLPFTCCLR